MHVICEFSSLALLSTLKDFATRKLQMFLIINPTTLQKKNLKFPLSISFAYHIKTDLFCKSFIYREIQKSCNPYCIITL